MLLRQMSCPTSKVPLAGAFGTCHLVYVLLCCLQRRGDLALLPWHRKSCPKVALVLGQLLQARRSGLAVCRGWRGVAERRVAGRVVLEGLLLRPNQCDVGHADLGMLVGLMLSRSQQLGVVRLLRLLVHGVLVDGLRRRRGTGLPPVLW